RRAPARAAGQVDVGHARGACDGAAQVRSHVAGASAQARSRSRSGTHVARNRSRRARQVAGTDLMPLTILITGFGPFPGAPFNPTGALVELLARQSPVQAGTRRVAHVFTTSYDTVDRELPALIAG